MIRILKEMMRKTMQNIDYKISKDNLGVYEEKQAIELSGNLQSIIKGFVALKSRRKCSCYLYNKVY